MKADRPSSEKKGSAYGGKLLRYIRKHGGAFLRDEDGSLHVVLGKSRIPLNFDRDNRQLAALLLKTCCVSSLSQAAQVAIQRLMVCAEVSSTKVCFRRFSALSPDRKRLYIPVDGGRLLQITADGIASVPNGANEDVLWLEHPCGEPLKYSPGLRPAETLAHFERLLVGTLACRVPEMRWLLAMHEGLFPYVRDLCPAQLLVVHIGPTQQGKTSGAQRFTMLHGLGLVKGDYSPAALASVGDVGLLVMDNKEQANFTQALIDFCLFLSTGAERGRCTQDGLMRRTPSGRPAAVITTIEGVYKPELKARCIDVQFAVSGGKLPRAGIESEIQVRRHELGSALVLVLQRYMQIRSEVGNPGHSSPVPEFEEHYAALCDLLRAYSEVASKPEGWSEPVVGVWRTELTGGEPDEDDLEHPLSRIFCGSAEGLDIRVRSERVEYQGRSGTLFLTECGTLLTLLQELRIQGCSLPRTAQGLSRRLRSAKLRALEFLDEELAPELPHLRRTAKSRPIGFFREDDVHDCPGGDLRAGTVIGLAQ